MLHKTEAEKPKRKQSKKRGKRGVAAAAEPEDVGTNVYAALDQMDFQPYHEPGGIKTIIESEAMKKQ